MDIPIVVATFNRPYSLKRILSSLDASAYPIPVKLYISIDSGGDEETLQIAKDYTWAHGIKEVIHHNENLGLRDHILFCSDLAFNHDAIIVLEDDLYVSPGFYLYTLQANQFYNDDRQISSVSLYAHSYNETAQLPFIPVIDDSDVFFMQVPSSWGQCWSKDQWKNYRTWYDQHKNEKPSIDHGIPQNVVNWPDSSWKKFCFRYLIESNTYFVYPRLSLTTNFGEPGIHFNKKLSFQQVPLLSTKKIFNLKKLSGSIPVYDSFCEISPLVISKFLPFLQQYNYTVDLYGMKMPEHIKTEYVLTTKQCTQSLFSFGREFKPHEYNMIKNLAGNDIFFTHYQYCDKRIQDVHISDNELYYFYKLRNYQIKRDIIVNKQNEYSAKQLLRLLIQKIKK